MQDRRRHHSDKVTFADFQHLFDDPRRVASLTVPLISPPRGWRMEKEYSNVTDMFLHAQLTTSVQYGTVVPVFIGSCHLSHHCPCSI